ncbi:MAG: hypothetical protein ACOYD9_07535, partial [Pyramidobacter sp.]
VRPQTRKILFSWKSTLSFPVPSRKTVLSACPSFLKLNGAPLTKNYNVNFLKSKSLFLFKNVF